MLNVDDFDELTMPTPVKLTEEQRNSPLAGVGSVEIEGQKTPTGASIMKE